MELAYESELKTTKKKFNPNQAFNILYKLVTAYSAFQTKSDKLGGRLER